MELKALCITFPTGNGFLPTGRPPTEYLCQPVWFVQAPASRLPYESAALTRIEVLTNIWNVMTIFLHEIYKVVQVLRSVFISQRVILVRSVGI